MHESEQSLGMPYANAVQRSSKGTYLFKWGLFLNVTGWNLFIQMGTISKCDRS